MAGEQAYKALSMIFLMAAVALFAAVIPIWPYGYYTLLRLVVTGFAIYGLVTAPTLASGHRVALGFIALLFNPLAPVYLSRAAWLPIDLGVGLYFLVLRSRFASRSDRRQA